MDAPEKASSPIYVTQPFLPPLDEFTPLLEAIWNSKVLTNGGPFHQQFETALCNYLGVQHLSLFTNGTLALVTALQALRITGEVITTPFSFVATTHSMLWNGITPIFVDIDPDTLNIDPERLEAAITPRTTAILPVHCYGIPCHVDAIQRIADNYNLKVIYDAAHAFGVQYHDEPLLGHGDLSVLSFHATKIFNTFEGGAIICPNGKIKQHIDHLKNFGIVDEITVAAPGINGKMSEFQAALGLLQLKYMPEILDRRAAIVQRYLTVLAEIPGIRCITPPAGTRSNHAYFPILVEADYPLSRDALFLRLKESNIHPRRYFYPLISSMPMYRGLPSAMPERLPVAHDIARKVLCLPLYPDLPAADLELILRILQNP